MRKNKYEKKYFFQKKSPAEKILNKYGYVVVNKFGDQKIDWLFEFQF